MTTTTSTKPTGKAGSPPPFTAGLLPDDGQLRDAGAVDVPGGLPASMGPAVSRYRQSVERLRDLQLAQSEALQAVESASAIDRSRLRESLTANRSDPAPTAPAAREHAERAAQRVTAALALAHEARDELIGAARANAHEIVADARADIEEHGRRLDGLLAQVEDEVRLVSTARARVAWPRVGVPRIGPTLQVDDYTVTPADWRSTATGAVRAVLSYLDGNGGAA